MLCKCSLSQISFTVNVHLVADEGFQIAASFDWFDTVATVFASLSGGSAHDVKAAGWDRFDILIVEAMHVCQLFCLSLCVLSNLII